MSPEQMEDLQNFKLFKKMQLKREQESKYLSQLTQTKKLIENLQRLDRNVKEIFGRTAKRNNSKKKKNKHSEQIPHQHAHPQQPQIQQFHPSKIQIVNNYILNKQVNKNCPPASDADMDYSYLYKEYRKMLNDSIRSNISKNEGQPG